MSPQPSETPEGIMIVMHVPVAVPQSDYDSYRKQCGDTHADKRFQEVAQTAIRDIILDDIQASTPSVRQSDGLMATCLSAAAECEHAEHLEKLAEHLSYARCPSREFPMKALIFNRGISINRWLNRQDDIPDDIKDRIERRMASEMDELLGDLREHGTLPLRKALNAFCLEHLQSQPSANLTTTTTTTHA